MAGGSARGGGSCGTRGGLCVAEGAGWSRLIPPAALDLSKRDAERTGRKTGESHRSVLHQQSLTFDLSYRAVSRAFAAYVLAKLKV